jgi:hypothetical protein
MTIDGTSPFNLILAETRIEIPTDDFSDWNTIDEIPSALSTLITDDALDFVASAGIFSVDLTDIKGYCYDSYNTSGQYYCQYDRINEYDGLANGLYITTMTDADAFANYSYVYY